MKATPIVVVRFLSNVSNLGKGTNWQDETLSTGVPIIGAFSGGSDKITYSVSGST
jgi:hypothetical protein